MSGYVVSGYVASMRDLESYDFWVPLPKSTEIEGLSRPLIINNVVVTLNVDNYVPSNQKTRTPGASRFKPDRTERFLGEDFSGTVLIFRSGKGVIVGLTGTAHLPLLLAHVQGYLSQVCGHFCALRRIGIQNIVVNSQITDEKGNDVRVNLHALRDRAHCTVSYTPEQFPGARLTLGTYSVNLFQSGKYVLPGVKNIKCVLEANRMFLDFIEPHRPSILK